MAPGFEDGNNSRFSRIIDLECMSCHNALPQMHEGSERQFEQIPLGIDCERCHGPGELHVNKHLKGQQRSKAGELDRSIVNPAKLSLELQMDICQRCHLQGLNILKEGKSFADFRPGMRLRDVFSVYLPEYEGEASSFDMANHSARLQMSKCFTESKGSENSLSCISCHDPHLGVTQTHEDYYRARCMHCHQDKGCTGLPEGLRFESADCISCHMPEQGSSDILHVQVHDHYIRKQLKGGPRRQVEKLVGLYAVNDPSPSKEELAAAYLGYWEKFDKNPFYLQKADELLSVMELPALSFKLHYLKGEYDQALKWVDQLGSLDAWQAYMVGECYLQEQYYGTAAQYLSISVKLDPDRPEVRLRLLKALIASEELELAVKEARGAMQLYPKHGGIANQAAIAYLRSGKVTVGERMANRALRLEPMELEVWETQFNLQRMLDQQEGVRYWGQRILERQADHPNADQIKRLIQEMR